MPPRVFIYLFIYLFLRGRIFCIQPCVIYSIDYLLLGRRSSSWSSATDVSWSGSWPSCWSSWRVWSRAESLRTSSSLLRICSTASTLRSQHQVWFCPKKAPPPQGYALWIYSLHIETPTPGTVYLVPYGTTFSQVSALLGNNPQPNLIEEPTSSTVP